MWRDEAPTPPPLSLFVNRPPFSLHPPTLSLLPSLNFSQVTPHLRSFGIQDVHRITPPRDGESGGVVKVVAEFASIQRRTRYEKLDVWSEACDILHQPCSRPRSLHVLQGPKRCPCTTSNCCCHTCNDPSVALMASYNVILADHSTASPIR
jgi:hypothetical protein